MFSQHLFHKTGLGAAFDVLSGVIFINPLYLLWIHSLTWLGQFKQKFL